MQNLSFKSVATVKPVEEVAKNNPVAGKTNQNSSNAQDDLGAQNSFQSLLNKQVQAKRGAEHAAAKAVAKTTHKTAENSQQNQKVDEQDSSANLAGDAHRANIDELVARLNTLRPEGEGKSGDLATEKVVEDEVEDAEVISSLTNAVNSLQPQEMMAQLLMRAQLQPAKAESETQKFEGQSSSDDMALVRDGILKEVSAATLNNALSEGSPQPTQGEAPISNMSSWKDTFSEKMTGRDMRESGATLSEASAKELPLQETAMKFLGNEKSKESMSSDVLAKDFSKELTAASNLQAQQMSQQALAPSAQTVAQAGSSNQIMAYPGRAGWNQEISQKVVWMVGNGEQSATLTLNPPDLGPVQVVINVNNNQADAAFFSDNADVRQALEDGLEHLRESMQSSGLQLGQANINAGQQSQQSFQEMAQRQSNGTVIAPQSAIGAELPTTGMVIRESQGLVDTFA